MRCPASSWTATATLRWSRSPPRAWSGSSPTSSTSSARCSGTAPSCSATTRRPARSRVSKAETRGRRGADRGHDHGGGRGRHIRGRAAHRAEDRLVLRPSGQPGEARRPGRGPAGARSLLLHRRVGDSVRSRAERARCTASTPRPTRSSSSSATRPATGSRTGCVPSAPTRCARSRRCARPASASTRWCSIPPAFIRRRKDRTKGFEAYRRANGLALQLLAPGGWLVSASCSAHLERAKHLEIIARVSRTLSACTRASSRKAGRTATIPFTPPFPKRATSGRSSSNSPDPRGDAGGRASAYRQGIDEANCDASRAILPIPPLRRSWKAPSLTLP